MRVENNTERSRFEAHVDGDLAVLEYVLFDGGIRLRHTEVPERLRGRGVASVLARTALEHARESSLVVEVVCPFVKAFIRRHPEYRPLTRPPSRDPI